jgi:hypothetical protein
MLPSEALFYEMRADERKRINRLPEEPTKRGSTQEFTSSLEKAQSIVKGVQKHPYPNNIPCI